MQGKTCLRMTICNGAGTAALLILRRMGVFDPPDALFMLVLFLVRPVPPLACSSIYTAMALQLGPGHGCGNTRPPKMKHHMITTLLLCLAACSFKAWMILIYAAGACHPNCRQCADSCHAAEEWRGRSELYAVLAVCHEHYHPPAAPSAILSAHIRAIVILLINKPALLVQSATLEE